MIARLAVRIRRFQRWCSRSYWELRIMPLSKSEASPSAPGLLLVQIDGLGQKEFQKALQKGRLPFLKRLIEKEKYAEHSHYSGLPSATPGVQGELFYGIKNCVPAFNFLDRETNEVFTMYDPRWAGEIERRLGRENRGLLEGGSSYGNIFSGGAQESHFCAATIGWQGFFKTLNPLRWVFLFVFHFDILIRTAALLVIEFFYAALDSVRGILKGQYVFYELQFILSRVLVCVLMRELIVLGAKIDIARGLPVIHLNFFGYDEQAHRRGPSSAFAHWCLKGIDDAVRRVWKEGRWAERRNYDLWIYSDHGQEDTTPYPMKFKKRAEDVIAEIFGETLLRSKPRAQRGCCSPRIFHKHSSKGKVPDAHAAKAEAGNCQVKALGMGPLCHLYLSQKLTAEEKVLMAQKIVDKAQVPLVLIAEPDGVKAVSPWGIYDLPKDRISVLGHDHPFLEEVTRDLIQLCHHPNAGDLIVSGWIANKSPMTFPVENGSHAGFGSRETNGVALLPQDAPLPERDREYLRPCDIREAALQLLGRGEKGVTYHERPRSISKFLRIASYNVHGCMGIDGKIAPQRIARVIARHSPDAVAMQELDAHCSRSGSVHQAETIAKKLQMDFHFHPSMCRNETGHYGNAILSRYPSRVVKGGPLPQLARHRFYEPRGVLWVELDVYGTKVQVLTTHLGFWPKEATIQMEALLGPDWLGNPLCKNPVILAGDFNASPSSRAYKKITERLNDAQLLLEAHRPHGTWLSSHSFTRIDHLFVSSDIKVTRVVVPSTELDRTASDHFPLFIDLQIPGVSIPDSNGTESKKKEAQQGKEEHHENDNAASSR